MHHLSQIAARSLKAGFHHSWNVSLVQTFAKLEGSLCFAFPEGDQDAADKAEQSLINFGARGMYLYSLPQTAASTFFSASAGF